MLTHEVVTKAYLKIGIYLVLIAFALGGAYVFEESFNASNMALTDGASFVNFLIVSFVFGSSSISFIFHSITFYNYVVLPHIHSPALAATGRCSFALPEKGVP